MEDYQNDYIVEEANAIYNTYAHGAFFMTSKLFVQFVGLEAAVLLADLISKDLYFSKKTNGYDGWFFNTMINIKEYTKLSREKQDKAVRKLVELEIVFTKRKGIPAKKYYKINHSLINELEKIKVQQIIDMNDKDIKQYINNKQTRLCEIHKQHSVKYTNINNNKVNNNKEKKLNYIVAEKNPQQLVIKNERYLPLAKILVVIIQNKKDIKITANKLNSWSNSIRLLCEQDKVGRGRVRKALNWYTNHCYEDYVPVIESGKSLREKFLRLESAIERETNPINNQPKQTGYIGKPIKYTEGIKI